MLHSSRTVATAVLKHCCGSEMLVFVLVGLVLIIVVAGVVG